MNEATEEYIIELKDRMNYRISEVDYSVVYANKYVDYRGVHINDYDEISINYNVDYDINRTADEYLKNY